MTLAYPSTKVMDQAASPVTTPAAVRRRRRRFFEFKSDIPFSWSLSLGILVWVLFFGFWEFAVWQNWANEILLPGPGKVLSALHTLFTEKPF